MSSIVLTPDQVEVLKRSQTPVTVVDTNGKTLSQIARRWFSEERIADAKRRINEPEPSFTTAEVLEHLRSLERS
jgi:hypothetical protein